MTGTLHLAAEADPTELLASAVFAVEATDTAARTITGLCVPFGTVTTVSGGRWQFQAGALTYADTRRVKLLRDHDHAQVLGVATKLWETPQGLMGTFKVSATAAGDEALLLASDGVLDGLSVGATVTASTPNRDGSRTVTAAQLREVTLTAMPAYDSARVSNVAATQKENTAMKHKCPKCQAAELTLTAGQAAVCPCGAQVQLNAAQDAAELVTTAPVATPPAGQQTQQVQAGQTAPTGPVAVAAATGTDAPHYVRDAPVYTMDGRGQSLVRDLWASAQDRDPEAAARVTKFNAQLCDNVQLAASLGLAAPHMLQAAQTTAGSTEILPPGYRPDLYIGEEAAGRPLVSQFRNLGITNAQPFDIPEFLSKAGLAADHVEGVNPASGSITFDTVTVRPKAKSGIFDVTRELVDSSNPAIDVIARDAMKESYDELTELDLVALFFDPTDGIGAPALVTGDWLALSDAIDADMLSVLSARRRAVDFLVAGTRPYGALASARDTTNRPIFPRVGATNAPGTVGAGLGSLDYNGLAMPPAWSLDAADGADVDTVSESYTLTGRRRDALVFESPVQQFRFEQVLGPAAIRLAQWGYFGAAILRKSSFKARNYAG